MFVTQEWLKQQRWLGLDGGLVTVDRSFILDEVSTSIYLGFKFSGPNDEDQDDKCMFVIYDVYHDSYQERGLFICDDLTIEELDNFCNMAGFPRIEDE